MAEVSTADQEPLSVLDSPLFVTDPPIDEGPVALTTLLAHLLAGDSPVHGFPRLAAEQRGYWHRFLVRCAAKALHELGVSVDEASSQDRGELAAQFEDVLAEAAGGRTAWHLWGTDSSEPAFLQPPTPEGEPPKVNYKKKSLGHLSVAIGGKNHERKVDAVRSLRPEEAIYALVAFQSGVIYSIAGAGYRYGASQLMGSKSGATSGTPFMGVRIGSDLGATFLHDAEVFLENWSEIRRNSGLRGHVWALWTEYWDGSRSLPAADLDPAFIPLARLIRLEPPLEEEFESVWFRRSRVERVEDHTDGNMGDIFTPLVPHPDHDDVWKVRGALSKGYDYKEVVRLLGLHEDGRPSLSVRHLQHRRSGEQSDHRVLFEAVAFDQGKTLGFHHREVLLPAGFVKRRPWDNPDPAREAHREMLSTVSDAKSALRGAARFLLAGSPRPRQGDQGKVEAPARLIEQRVDQIYLERLFEAARLKDDGDDSYRRSWGEEVADMALEAFRETREEIPSAAARRYEREVRAESWLRGRLNQLRSPQEQPREPEAASSDDTKEGPA